MNKKELLNAIAAKKDEIRAFAKDGKVNEMKEAKNELVDLQERYDALDELDEDGLKNMKKQAAQGTAQILADNKEDGIKAWVNVLRDKLTGKTASQEDMDIVNQMSEGTPEDGGLTVPEDVDTSIREMRRSEDALETLVTVEAVSTEKGSRVYEVNADQVPFEVVGEGTEFPEADTPKFKKIAYQIKKLGQILQVTYELLQDSDANIIAFLKKWIAKKSKATRNMYILRELDGMTKGKEVTVATVDDLKDVFNVKLDPAIAAGASVLTNQSGFNFLDKLKDSDGRYILQPDPTKATPGLLFGKYPVKTVSNKTLKPVGNKIPMYCGDFKEAVTIYDREETSIDINNVAGSLWKNDLTGIKVRERLDFKTIDDEAIVKCEITTTETFTAQEVTDTTVYVASDLEDMTIDAIKAIATKRSYTITKEKKAEIIDEFLAAQNA